MIFMSPVLVTILSLACRVSASPCNTICSRMYQHCVEEFSTGEEQGTSVVNRQGKAGPRGPPGPAGEVNYTRMNQEIASVITETESRIDAKLQECVGRLNEMELRMAGFTLPTGCDQVHKLAANSWNGTGGLFDIYISRTDAPSVVYCDLTTNYGGWMVIQRRMDGAVDFFRNWDEYVQGFGKMNQEFWLGLETLHRLTTTGRYQLRIDMLDWDNTRKYAQYGLFAVGNGDDGYRLTIGDYTGSAGDSLARHNGHRFSTKDRDQDINSANCAMLYKGGWWYDECHRSNLNGRYIRNGAATYGIGVVWYDWKGYTYSLKSTEMKIRRV